MAPSNISLDRSKKGLGAKGADERGTESRSARNDTKGGTSGGKQALRWRKTIL